MRKRSLFVSIMVLLVLLAATVLAYRAFWPRSRTQNTALVRRGSIQASVEALARVQSTRQLILSLRVGGKVKRILVQEGQAVEEGALLLEVESRESQDAVEQAERALKIRRLQWEEALSAPSGSAITLARARLQRATAARLKAQKDYDKIAGAPDAESSDEALDLETAKLEYELAQAEYDRVLEGTPKLDLERMRADVQEAETTWRQARERLEDTRLYAPFSGTIMRLEVKEGENAYSYSPLIRLADLSRLEISAEVDELDIPEVAQGQRVSIRLDAFPTQLLEGSITRLLPGPSEGRGTTTYQALVEYEGKGLPIRPGMGANLTIITRSDENALLVPKRAIRQVGRYQVVRVLAGGQPREVVVQTGLSNDEEIQILSGLDEGQTILLN